MKDYYKILRVKENASEEEIRARWVELMKHYHPDRGKDKVSGERIKEINEAYQVLKHSSTRVEYDLRRTYGQEKKEGKRGFYFKKLGVPVSIFIVLIIISILYYNQHQDEAPSLSKPVIPNGIRQINSKNKADSTPPQLTNGKDVIKPTNATKPLNPISQTAMVSKGKPVSNPTDPLNPTNVINPTNAVNPPDTTTPVAVVTTTQNVQLQLAQQPPIPSDAIEQKTQRFKDSIDPTDSPDLMLQLAQFKPPSLLATEEEVRKFFNNYIERYNRMDIEGFLSLFSLKAIQNQKDGFEGIRKIYGDFFKQGQGVRYHLRDMKIEIYQNAIEVIAGYEIEQILKMGGEKKIWRGNARWVLNKENGVLKIVSLDYQHQKSV